MTRLRNLSRRAAIGLGLAAGLAACGGGDDASVDEGRAVPFSRVPADTGIAVWPSRTYVVRTPGDWSAAWNTQEFLATQWPWPLQPDVDFASVMVVGLSMGTGPNGCHGLRIERVTELADTVRVEYRRTTDTGTQACTQATVRLVDFVRIPVTTKPVSFAAMGA
ncbi:MAG: hypothetical protein MUC74_07645 [Ideonella sp.]|jgi:hypothetical protein|nr:hypothetical protein [Ideonella sp.]